ncbi:glycoside hydrolase family 2 [Curtobacterium sp. MCBD17_013]|uniref:glycoside hydrolase family 2 protein n=1 Tax=Curtobacterium sp. MCBD17_013 TaxID=2175668 RepID=UPI000DA998B1|nr:sugar-binding domain-containing protein [Curtobacterium sp. MCBD17_013]PZF65148.1 glycoside hydrolase family 2 [Curtobacterium sp. MCBD17_013]
MSTTNQSVLPTASRQDGRYPRPQLMRAAWADLTGVWSFRSDDEDEGLGSGWASGINSHRTIVVPFPPESVASGIDEPGFHPVIWYERKISASDLDAAGRTPSSTRLLLHFGAVDYRAKVWIDGAFVGEHEGGHTPFSFDITHLITGHEHRLVVRAEDDPVDVTQPRGKQDWHEDPHAIWYRRTTGIWQTVWLEAVPSASIDYLRWTPNGIAQTDVTIRFRGSIPEGTQVQIRLRSDEYDEGLGWSGAAVARGAKEIVVPVPVARQRNGQAEQELLWSPEHPRLIDAQVTLCTADGTIIDAVSSYLGLRSLGVDRGVFLLNGHPYNVRSVLNQAYWPDSHLAAPTPLAHRDEVELIKALGFTACRIHQKIEDPRFLYWADRLGLLVWAETPGAYEFSPRAVGRLTREWVDAVERDASHPSIVTWVPFNESWGIQHVAEDTAQQAYSRALTDLTRALDPTRPVVSNDGWEHQNSDILSVHDYEGDGSVLAATYADETARARLLRGMGPAGRRLLVGGAIEADQPVMLTEFGGVNYQPGAPRDDAWGYTSAADGDDWITRITALYDAIRASQFLAGSCYTQLTDTMQETNGLCDADRSPKVAIERIRAAVTGR